MGAHCACSCGEAALMAWQLNGTYFEHGDVDGLDVSDKTVVVVADTPQVMDEGNWRLGVVMDAAASPEQAAGLGAVFGGQAGGPMAGLAPLVTEMLGMETAPIEYVDDGRRHSLKVGELIDIEIEDFVPPQLLPDGDVEMLTGMFHPANSTLTIASATRSRVSVFGLDFANEG